jgi:hypothetical protein
MLERAVASSATVACIGGIAKKEGAKSGCPVCTERHRTINKRPPSYDSSALKGCKRQHVCCFALRTRWPLRGRTGAAHGFAKEALVVPAQRSHKLMMVLPDALGHTPANGALSLGDFLDSAHGAASKNTSPCRSSARRQAFRTTSQMTRALSDGCQHPAAVMASIMLPSRLGPYRKLSGPTSQPYVRAQPALPASTHVSRDHDTPLLSPALWSYSAG